MYTNGQIVLLKNAAQTKEEIIRLLSEELYQKGYVTSDFATAVLSRETVYPTGLDINGLGVAIPHTDADKVQSPQLAFATLKEPVAFQNMVDISQTINVSMVFLLAIKKSDEQVFMLQKLIEIFQNQELMDQLQKVEQEKEFIRIIRQAGIQ